MIGRESFKIPCSEFVTGDWSSGCLPLFNFLPSAWSTSISFFSGNSSGAGADFVVLIKCDVGTNSWSSCIKLDGEDCSAVGLSKLSVVSTFTFFLAWELEAREVESSSLISWLLAGVGVLGLSSFLVDLKTRDIGVDYWDANCVLNFLSQSFEVVLVGN